MSIFGYSNSKVNFDNKKILEDMASAYIRDYEVELDTYESNTSFGKLKKSDENKIYENDDYVTVMSGYIYNDKELMDEISDNDFECNDHARLITSLFKEKKEDMPKLLRGVFNIAIFDKKNDCLFLVRDNFGVKPMYYTQNTKDKTFIFGSEIKAFLKHPSFNKELNKKALKPYLTFQYPVLEETFFKGVFKLQPAHYLIYKDGEIKTEKYWEPKFNPGKENLEYYVDLLKTEVKKSVDIHLRDQKNYSSFLSGGVDSSYITSVAKPSDTYSVGFKEYSGMFNETDHAKDLSEILGLKHHVRLITGEDCFEVLPKMQYLMDEPQSNLSSIPLYFLSEFTSKDAQVILSGEGSDELFGGYLTYKDTKTMHNYRKLPIGFRKSVAKLAKALPDSHIKSAFIRGGQTVEESFFGEAKVYTPEQADAILKDEYKNGVSPYDVTKPIYEKYKNENDLTKKQLIDIFLWAPGDIFLKASKMTSPFDLEVRMPFVDKKIMEVAGSIPERFRVNNVDTKYILRKVAYEYLPEEWAKRPKLGFPVPMKFWLKKENIYNYVKEVFSRDYVSEFFDQDKLLELLEKHYNGKELNQRYIYTALCFLLWYDEFFIKR